jgi:hypothetical protein
MNLDTLAKTAGDVADPTTESLLAGRRQLDQAIAGAGARVAAVRRNRRPRRWGASILAGAAAVTAALIAVPLVVATPASAESVLLAAAEGAGEQVDEAIGAEYWHVVSEVEYPETGEFTREVWMGRTADSILIDGFPVTDDGAPGGQVRTIQPESLGGPAVFISNQQITWDELEALPTDADELGSYLRQLAQTSGGDVDDVLWESIGELLLESPASPSLRRAAWNVAASIPDVELLGDMTDAAGRPGVAVERDQLEDNWYRELYILDPSDGTLLEAQSIDAEGTVVWRTTLIEQGPADTAPEAQPFFCGPGSVSGESC